MGSGPPSGGGNTTSYIQEKADGGAQAGEFSG